MRGIFEDITGKKYGSLTVIERAKNHGHDTYWLCRCDCGNLRECQAGLLKTGMVNSCGCKTSEHCRIAQTVHNLTNTRIHHIWSNMKQRCYNKKSISYPLYGQRGVVVCDEWRNDFMRFYCWAKENGYKENLTLDRIDFNGNYCPENCRWVDKITQQNNKRNSHYLTHNGQTHTVSEWGRITGIKPGTIFARLRRGIDIKTALTVKRIV